MQLKIKASLIFISLALAVSSLFAQVHFEDTKDLNQIIAKAGKENKLIYIDGYTDWCGWCKELDKKVFCAGKVADTINANFISAKFEMEKDSFGVLLARKYAVNGFPTAIILSPDGRAIAFLSGYAEPDYYLKLIQQARDLAKTGKTIRGYSTDLAPAFPEFYLKAFPLSGKKVFPDSAFVNNYVSGQVSIVNEVDWSVINRFSFWINSANEQKTLLSLDSLNQFFGNEGVQSFLHNYIGNRIQRAIRNKNASEYEASVSFAEKHLTDPKPMLFNYKLSWYKQQGQWSEYGKSLYDGVKDSSLPLSPETLNRFCWDIYTECEDPETIKLAVEIMDKKVVAVSDTYAYHDTYAALIYKSGDLVLARKETLKAIEIGKSGNEDVSETEKLLRKIESQKNNK